MKNILSSILILTQILWITPAKSALSDPDKAIIAHVNMLKNPGLENGKAGQTVTTGVLTIDTTNFLEGKQSGLMTFSSSIGDVQSNVATTQHSGMNMSASCKVKTAATSIQFCGMANGIETSCVAVPSNDVWSPMSINFNGPTNGQTVGYKIKNTSASGTVTFNYDGCDVGQGSISSVSQSNLFGLVKITGCSSQFQSTSDASTSYANMNGTSPTGCVYTLVNNAQQPSTNIAAIKFASMPAGDYAIEIEGYLVIRGMSAQSQGMFRFSDGTNTSREESSYRTGGSTTDPITPNIRHTFSYASTQSNVTWQIQDKSDGQSGARNYIANSNAAPAVIRVYYYPSSTSQVINPNITPASWSGYHNGISSGCGTTSATYADTTACTGITLNQITNRNFGTVTTASGSLPGITFNPPRTGTYQVCAYVSQNDSASSNPGVRMVDGSGTIINPGVYTLNTTSATTNAVCGKYLAASTSATTFKLQLATNVGTTFISTVSAPSGTAHIQWTITEEDAAMPSPVLTGNVTSNSTGMERIERFSFGGASNPSSCTSTPCTVYYSSSPVTVTRSALGVYSAVFTAPYSAPFQCSAIFHSANNIGSLIRNGVTTTSTIGFDTRVSTSAASQDSGLDVICMGPR